MLVLMAVGMLLLPEFLECTLSVPAEPFDTHVKLLDLQTHKIKILKEEETFRLFDPLSTKYLDLKRK